LIPGAVDFLDFFFAGFILRMGFAGINDLQSAASIDNAFEPLDV